MAILQVMPRQGVIIYLISLFYHIEAETNGLHFSDNIFKCIFLNENM